MSEGLSLMGIKVDENKDSMVIHGKGPNASLKGNLTINSKLDHRIAMSFLCMGLITEDRIKVEDTDTINSSFPSFFEIMKKIGADLKYA